VSEDFTPYSVIPAEGERLGILTCKVCGAAVLLDADIDWPRHHREWHALLDGRSELLAGE
jgi:hypothetical protein